MCVFLQIDRLLSPASADECVGELILHFVDGRLSRGLSRSLLHLLTHRAERGLRRGCRLVHPASGGGGGGAGEEEEHELASTASISLGERKINPVLIWVRSEERNGRSVYMQKQNLSP